MAQVEDSYYVRVGSQTAHGLGLSLNARAGGLVQPLGFDQGEGHLPVQQGVVGQVNPLLATLSQ